MLLEAMACGVPCIGTDVGGIPEVITHGETGFLVPLGDIDGAAKHAVSLLKDEALHEKCQRQLSLVFRLISPLIRL